MKDLISTTSSAAIAAVDVPPLEDLYCDAREYEPDLHWNYAAKGILCRGETSVLYGPSNCGKSAVVCHLGHCITTGIPFFGAKVRQGLVIHVCAEAPKSVLERVHAYPHVETAAPYLVRRAGVDLSLKAEVDRFVDEVGCLSESSGHEVVLVVFDTLARSIGVLDENCSSSMTRIAETAEFIASELGAHVMMVHHTGKDADRGGRGSSALRGAVFTELSLKPQEKLVVVNHEKQRTMPKSLPLQFRTKPVVLGKDEDGEQRTTVHIEEIEGKVEMSRQSPRQKEAGAFEGAVLTALHVRKMMSKRSAEPFNAGELIQILPSEFFGDAEAKSRVRRVNRALEKIAERPKPPVAKTERGWCLQSAASTKGADQR